MSIDLTKHPQYLQAILTASSPEEVFYFLKMGAKNYLKINLPIKSILVLLSHTALETGRFRYGMYNFNFGNIRANVGKLKPNEFFTLYKCSEILNNKEVWFYPPDPNCSFRAFRTLEEGMAHHLSFLAKPRYAKAWQKVIIGDPAGYSLALHDCGYYTASPALYTRGLVRLAQEYEGKAKTLSEWQPALLAPVPEPFQPIFTDWEIQQLGGLAGVTAQESYRLFERRKEIEEYEDYYRVKPSWWDQLKNKVIGK
jgi:hypothetical protein